MTTYYFANAGDNNNSGTTSASPWQTITKLNSSMGSISAGDEVRFNRGDDWTGEGRIYWTAVGTAASRITLADYGSGALPILDNTSGTGGNDCIQFQDAPYITVENLNIAGAVRNGINVNDTDSHHLIIQDCTFTGCNICVLINSASNLVTRCTMASPVRTQDAGAIGVMIYRSSNTVSYCTMNGLIDSYGGSNDGCGVELFSVFSADDCVIHHNLIQDSFCAFELGSNNAAYTIHDLEAYYNVCVNNQGRFLMISSSGAAWPVDLSNNVFANNTVVQSIAATETPARIVNVAGNLSSGEVYVTNNIIYCADSAVSTIFDDADIDETYNCIRYGGSTTLGLTADATDVIDDPSFTNLGGGDYTLQVGSPCIDVGTNLGYTLDYAGNTVPNNVTDIGAYEYYAAAYSDAMIVIRGASVFILGSKVVVGT